MPKPLHVRTVAALLGILLVPSLAPAWTPYGSGPYSGFKGEGEPARPPAGPGEIPAPQAEVPGYGGYGYPPFGAGPAMPFAPYGPGPGIPGTPFGGGAAHQAAPPGSSWAAGTPRRFNLVRGTSEDAYTLDIQLENMKPQQIQVDIQGRWLRIGTEDTREDLREEQFDDGRGFVRSFSYSTGSNVRRVSLPRDADPAGMSREDRANSVHLRIPRVRR